MSDDSKNGDLQARVFRGVFAAMAMEELAAAALAEVEDSPASDLNLELVRDRMAALRRDVK